MRPLPLMLLAPCLALWLAAAVAPGVAAYSAFRVLPKEGVVVPRFKALAADDAETMGRLAAGRSLQPAFQLSDRARWVLAPAALLLALAAGCWRRGGRAVLALLILALLALAAGQALGWSMQAPLERWWALAEAGDLQGALASRRDFDALHPWAERATSLEAISLLAALLLVPAAAVRRTP